MLKPLTFLIGHWRTEGEILGDSGEVVARVSGTDSYEWISGGHFILHRVDVMMGDNKIEVIEIIGGYDPTNKSYAMRSFDNEGKFTTMSGKFEKDGTFEIEGEGMRSYLAYDKNSNTMNIRWEKQNNSQWELWIDMTLKKIDRLSS